MPIPQGLETGPTAALWFWTSLCFAVLAGGSAPLPLKFSAPLLPGAKRQSLGGGHLTANLDLLGTRVGTAPGEREARSVDTALSRCVLESETHRKGHPVAWAGTGLRMGVNHSVTGVRVRLTSVRRTEGRGGPGPMGLTRGQPRATVSSSEQTTAGVQLELQVAAAHPGPGPSGSGPGGLVGTLK